MPSYPYKSPVGELFLAVRVLRRHPGQVAADGPTPFLQRLATPRRLRPMVPPDSCSACASAKRRGYPSGSIAAGAGSVVGDTTTTMMWIDGISPLAVLHAYVAAAVALLIFGIPAARQQQRFAPIVKQAPKSLHIEWTRLFIVAAILICAVAVNVIANTKVSGAARYAAIDRYRRVGCHSGHRAAPSA